MPSYRGTILHHVHNCIEGCLLEVGLLGVGQGHEALEDFDKVVFILDYLGSVKTSNRLTCSFKRLDIIIALKALK